jgi:hypothetical protein
LEGCRQGSALAAAGGGRAAERSGGARSGPAGRCRLGRQPAGGRWFRRGPPCRDCGRPRGVAARISASRPPRTSPCSGSPPVPPAASPAPR